MSVTMDQLAALLFAQIRLGPKRLPTQDVDLSNGTPPLGADQRYSPLDPARGAETRQQAHDYVHYGSGGTPEQDQHLVDLTQQAYEAGRVTNVGSGTTGGGGTAKRI